MTINIETMIKALTDKIGKTVYSMEGSRNFSDGTCDCSGAVYYGLRQAGGSDLGWIPSTETLHAYLINNGFELVSENSDWQAQRGDVVIWGRKGFSAGEFGHTGVFINNIQWLECTAYLNLGETIQNHDTRWAMNNRPYFYAYRLKGYKPDGKPQPQPEPKPQPKPQPQPKPLPNVYYSLRVKFGQWLPEVKNLSDFAGLPNHAHDLLALRVDRGSIKYRVHTNKSGWLGWVTQCNRNDLANGVAGNPNEAIDGVQIYYTSPTGEIYQAYYRSQTIKRSGWLGVCCDDGTSYPNKFDSWAGELNEPLDRLQIAISNRNPF